MKKCYTLPGKKFFLILMTLGLLRETNAQSGTDFWFAPPFVTHVHNAPGGVPIYLLLSSMGAASTVTVSQPANGGFAPIVVTIAAGKSKRIDLSAFQSQLETHPTNSILNTGLRIIATTAITANYEEDNTNNPEDFALKGANALGTDFYIPLTNYVPFANHNFGVAGQEAIASFDIVASQNGTVVTIYSPVPVDGHPALTQFSITLNAGQTYSCGWTGANYTVPSTHPGGAAVHSTLPVAITVKDDSDTNPSGGCYDLIGDQIVPTAILGTDYVAVKGSLNPGGNEGMFITSTQNNTNIYIDGNPVPVRTMFAGETYRVDMDSVITAADQSVYVRASNPVYATHVTGFGCEMGSAILPPLNCAGSHQVNFMRSTSEAFYLTILVHASAINNFTITGSGTATISSASFSPVPGTGGLWDAAKILFSTIQIPVDSAFSVTNSTDVFALGIINGGAATGCRYGYFSEFVAPIVVNAGPDQVVCANDTVQLSASVTGGSSTGKWTGTGSGTFLPSNTTTNAKYVPSLADITAGSVTLTLSSTSICFPQQDQVLITLTPAPKVNAGVNQTICKNNPAVTLNGSVTIATGGLWSGGAGSFTPSNAALNAVYTPTPLEIAAGTLVLTLTSTGNGTCHSATNNMVITFAPSPVVNAGPTQTLCSNNSNVTLSGTVTGATGGIWTGGTGSFSPSATALNAIYSPSATELSAGSVSLTLTSTGNGNCNSVSGVVIINFTLPPTVNAGPDQSICKNNAVVTLSGVVTIGTGGQWTGGLGIFAPSSTTLNASYTPTAAEISSGSLTLTLTSTGNGNCTAATDQMVITFTASPTVSAGSNQSVCANNPNVVLNGSVSLATGGIWSGGAGTYTPNNTTLTATYTPTPLEITSGTVALTLTTTGNANCSSVSSSMTITITPSPVVNAGIDQTLCKNNPNAVLNGSVTIAGGGVWSGGAGGFAPTNTTLNAVYSPTVAELSTGSVTLQLTSTANGTCTAVSDQVVLTFSPTPMVNAGPDQTVCANNSAVTLSGSVSVSAGGQWSGGLGTFTPNNSTLNAIYHPTTAEIASGNLSLTLTTAGNGNCNAVTDQMTILFTPAPTVSAGTDQTVCKNNPAVTLNGTMTVATGINWSGGSGAFIPDNTTPNAVYTPGVSELTAGTATLTITTTGNGTCTAVTDQMIITVTPTPVVNAGPDQTICGNNPNATLSGSVTVAGGGVWSGGAGSFSPSNTAMNAIYSPTPAEIASGSITLTLTSTANGNCTVVTDQVVIHFTLPPTANAGADRTVCANNASVTLNGTITIASGGQWSGGLGTFNPNNTTLNAVYSPTAGETASGNVTLTLTTTGNGLCTAVTDQMVITFTTAPTVSAGVNQTACANNSAVTLSGSFSGATGIMWSGGSGAYAPNNTAPNATYTSSVAEQLAGIANLTLTTTGNGTCLPVTDNVIITITPSPQVNAGADLVACANKATVALSGTVSNASGGIWSGGAGNYNPSNTALNALYTPTLAEITAGSVTLILTSTGNGACNPVTDNMNITFNHSPVVSAGADQTVCANNAAVTLNGSVSNAGGGMWSAGSGTFNPGNTALNATYLPNQSEINSGNMFLILTSTSNGSCNAVSDTIALHFSPAPTVNAGTNQNSCANNPAIVLNGSHTVSSGAIWTGGLGTFSPNNTTMNPGYTATTAEIASGSVVLRLTTTGNGTCFSVYDSILLTIIPKPLVNAGTDQTVCVTNLNVQLSGSVSGSSNTGQWSSQGTGTFIPNTTALNAIYQCSKADSANGFVKLVLQSTNNGTCLPVIDTMRINILPAGGANAGSDVTVCGNNGSVNLQGTITGGASSGSWSTNGTGVFSPNNSALNGLYIPSPGDEASGSVTLTLTANSCNAAFDKMIITITPAPSVNAGTDQTVCSTIHSILLNGSVSGGTSTGVWTTTGTGSFVPGATNLNATYQITAADSAAQIIHLVLHSTNNGSCVAVTDTLKINIFSSSTVNAGSSQTTCGNNALVSLNGSVSNGGPGLWSTSGAGVFTPNATTLNATYTPGSGDISAGSVNLLLNATSSCNNAVGFMTVIITPPPVPKAGPDQSVCGSNPNVTLSATVTNASGGIWSGGNGTFSPGITALNATYTPTHAEVASGSVTLILTTTGNGSCNAVSDQLTINFTSSIVVNAGVDQQICRSAAQAQLQGIVSNGSSTGKWTTLGSGTFVPNDSTLNAMYNFSAADTSAGKVTLVLTTTHNGMCAAATDTMKIIFGPGAFAYAGVDQNICSTNTVVSLNGLVSGGSSSGQWSTLGSGTFLPNSQNLNASYTPGAADIANGTVRIVLNSTNNGGCLAGTDTMLITVNKPAVVNAGSDQVTCSNALSVSLNGTIGAGGSTGQWSTLGSGTFSPNTQALNATYLFGAGDYALGNVSIILHSTNNGACQVARDTMKIVLSPQTLVNAGSDQTLCASSAVATLNGQISGGSSTGIWNSTGTGSFSPNSQVLNATYNPGSADLALGQVSLVLTSSNTGLCPSTKDTLVIHFNAAPIASAGSDQTLCNGTMLVSLAGSITGSSSTGVWSTLGTGSFSPNAQTLHGTYVPGATDLTNGHVKLILETTNNGVCSQSSDTVLITFLPATIVNAGTDQSLCASGAIVQLNGTVQGGTATGVWNTLGSGSFSPNASALNAIYTPGSSDLSGGLVTLVLSSSNNGPCNKLSDTMIIRFSSLAVVNAGMDQSSCSGGAVLLNGSVNGGGGTGIWSTMGTGVFVPTATSMNTSYVPSAADRSSGGVKLMLTSTNNGQCAMVTDTMKLTFGAKPLAAFTSTVSGLTDTFSDQSIGAAGWIWDFGSGSGLSTQQNPVTLYSTGGTYTVTLIVTSVLGCSDTAHAEVVIVDESIVVHPVAVPSGFTPNGDHINDDVSILGGPFLETDLKIYNQWGNLIFSTSDPMGAWDGKFNGVDQPAGVYIYTAKGKTIDGKTFNFSGDVTLIR
jgi:gliding motility-associated-like protein